MLVTFTTAFAMMILGLGFIIFFMFFFSNQSRENIQYVVSNTGRQFKENVRFVEDGILSIRHNNTLENFLLKGERGESLDEDFAQSVDLFSERNRNSSSEPFVSRAYLFNVNGGYISSRYYPETINSTEVNDILYGELLNKFLAEKERYKVFKTSINNASILIIKLFDDNMKYCGACAFELNNDVLNTVFSPLEDYVKSYWEVGYRPSIDEGENVVISSFGETNLSGKGISQSNTYSFGIYSDIFVDNSNIYLRFGGIAMMFFAISVILLLLLAGRIINLIKAVYEKDLLAARTEVKYLQSQLNPHFQYNILAMLSIKAKATGDESLYQSLRAFSSLMRGKIFREKEIFIELNEEMELVEFYLHLQKDRFGDSLNYEISYDKESLGTVLIPKLIIEPLVENSVEHGIEPKTDPGTVKIFAAKQDDMLEITVEDDGVGMDESNSKKRTGTSLLNTRQLLKVLYPNKHEIKIETYSLSGTKVTIRIPVKYD